MKSTVYFISILLALVLPSECIKRKGSHGGRRYRLGHEIPPRFRTLQNVQHPQGNGPPRLQGPQARPQSDNRLRAEAAPFTPLGVQTPLPTGSGPYLPQGTMQHGPQGPRPERGQSYQPQVPAWEPVKKNICPLMCQPGQLAGEQCSSHPKCRCTIDLQSLNLAHLPCVFIPSG